MASDSTCISWVQFSENIHVIQKPVPSTWEGAAAKEEGKKKVPGALSQVLQNQELFWGLESLSHSPQSIKWRQERFLPAQGRINAFMFARHLDKIAKEDMQVDRFLDLKELYS